MLLISQIVYCLLSMFFADIELWHLIFPLLKFTFISLILFLFYKLFVKPGLRNKNRISGDVNHKKSGNPDTIKIELFRDRKRNPSLVNLIVRNNGNTEIDMEAPELIFKRLFSKRRFRIISVDFSNIYPMLIRGGSASVVRIDLEQFYGFAPSLMKACRLGAEMKKVDGRTFRSRTIRLKWW